MKGWFDAFRTDGGPTLYSYSNRTPVTGDPLSVTLYVIFFTVFAAFIIIFPGVRKEKFTTFLSVTLSLFVGTVILICNYGCFWHVATTEVHSSYRAFSKDKIHGEIGVNIGLNYVNITLRALPTHNRSGQIDFNERFYWTAPKQVQGEYNEALRKGLPYPILTVAEYFAMDAEGFCWGRMYRQAGYYAHIMLWASFAMWCLMNIFLCVVPRYGAYMMSMTGFMMLFTCLVYQRLLPKRALRIPFDPAGGSILAFDLGWSFWLVLVAGCFCVIIGAIFSIVDLVWPHTFSTILEVDYGTPFDRHVIIEDQKDRRHFKFQIPRLEEPLQEVGSRILRRLSTRLSRRGNEEVSKLPSGEPDMMGASTSGSRRHLSPLSLEVNRLGVDNQAFDRYEMDAPKSPWRYPNFEAGPFSRRTAGSSLSSNPVPIPSLNPSGSQGKFRPSSPTGHPSSLASSLVTKSPKSVSFRGDPKPELKLRVLGHRQRGDSEESSADEGSNVLSQVDSASTGIRRDSSLGDMDLDSRRGSAVESISDAGASGISKPQLMRKISSNSTRIEMDLDDDEEIADQVGELAGYRPDHRKESDKSLSASVLGLALIDSWQQQQQQLGSVKNRKKGSIASIGSTSSRGPRFVLQPDEDDEPPLPLATATSPTQIVFSRPGDSRRSSRVLEESEIKVIPQVDVQPPEEEEEEDDDW